MVSPALDGVREGKVRFGVDGESAKTWFRVTGGRWLRARGYESEADRVA
jgi:hypothetical protein